MFEFERNASVSVRYGCSGVWKICLVGDFTFDSILTMIFHSQKSDTYFQNDLCVFWNNTGSTNSTWDQQGCVNYKQSWVKNYTCLRRVNIFSESVTYCKCNHLTNFAVLYYPYDDQPPESRGLTILTYVCAFLSIICCVITIFAHLLQHRQRTNQHKQILMSLCVALIGRDVFFLTGKYFFLSLSLSQHTPYQWWREEKQNGSRLT